MYMAWCLMVSSMPTTLPISCMARTQVIQTALTANFITSRWPDGDFVVGNDIAKFDVTKDLKNLKMPILIVAGRYDRVSVPCMAVQYKKYCPQAQFVMFEHSGHNPMVEEPEKEFPIIRAFLRN